ncbi:MAG: hypothetical protein ACO3YN_15850, partial [Rubrivivax sp.]
MSATGVFRDKDAGADKPVDLTLDADGADAVNYALTGQSGTTASIAKAAATVTARSASLTYNGRTQSVSGFTATGLVNGETEAVLTDVTTTG